MSIESAVFQKWKLSSVVPIPKGGDPKSFQLQASIPIICC